MSGGMAVSGAKAAAIDAGWALVELVIAALIVAAGLLGYVAYSSTPWLLLAATVFLVGLATSNTVPRLAKRAHLPQGGREPPLAYPESTSRGRPGVAGDGQALARGWT